MNTWYIEYAIGNVSNRNQVMDVNAFSQAVSDNSGKEMYRSMYLYDETIVPYLKRKQHCCWI